MATVSLTDTGQITIPPQIRDYLQLKPGDLIDLMIGPDGKVTIVPAINSVPELAGILHQEGMVSLSIEDMNKAVKEKRVKKYYERNRY